MAYFERKHIQTLELNPFQIEKSSYKSWTELSVSMITFNDNCYDLQREIIKQIIEISHAYFSQSRSANCNDTKRAGTVPLGFKLTCNHTFKKK